MNEFLKYGLVAAFSSVAIGGAFAAAAASAPDLASNWGSSISESANARAQIIGAIATLNPVIMAIGLGILAYIFTKKLQNDTPPPSPSPA